MKKPKDSFVKYMDRNFGSHYLYYELIVNAHNRAVKKLEDRITELHELIRKEGEPHEEA